MLSFSESSDDSLGRGITLRRSFLSEFADRVSKNDLTLSSRLDWVELVPENFLGRGGWGRRALLQISEAFPVALHGVTLSIGSVDPINMDYLSQLKNLAHETHARWVTDHLCFSSVNGVQFHNLLPLPFTWDAVNHVVNKVKQVQKVLDLPFGLENPSYYKVMPGAEMSEAQFITEVLEGADCKMLLDVNNVFVNCFNHSQDPIHSALNFLNEIPLNRVIEVHIAGHSPIQVGDESRLLDTHGAPVAPPVQLLLQELHQKLPVKTLLLEREQEIPSLDRILDEVSELWGMLNRYHNQLSSIPSSTMAYERCVR